MRMSLARSLPGLQFPLYVDASRVVSSYQDTDLTTNPLFGRAYAHCDYEDLEVGNVVVVFNNALMPVEPIALYFVVHKLDDGSSDAIRGFVSCPAVATTHPKHITFMPHSVAGTRQSVIILSATAIRTRGYPPSLAAMAKLYLIPPLVGASSAVSACGS